ncbi:unnamed protein product, partial [Prorocentrum cordatum]
NLRTSRRPPKSTEETPGQTQTEAACAAEVQSLDEAFANETKPTDAALAERQQRQGGQSRAARQAGTSGRRGGEGASGGEALDPPLAAGQLGQEDAARAGAGPAPRTAG